MMKALIPISIILTLCFCTQQTSQKSESKTLSNELHPSWSADGSKICFQSNKAGNDDVYVMVIDTRETVRITTSDSADTGPVWSPNNQYIVFESLRNGKSDIYLTDSFGAEVRAISTENHSEIQPSWTNENTIVYAADVEGQWQLFRSNLSGEKEQLTFAKRDHLSPAPGNKANEILFSISDRGNHQTDVELMRFNMLTREATPLTLNAGVSSNASTQLNQNLISFNSKRQENWDIYIMNYDGTDQKAVTTNRGSEVDFEFSDLDGQPALSPDGEWIAFTSGRSGSFDIFLVKIDGSEFINLTEDWIVD